MWLGIHSGWRPGSLLDRTSTGSAITFWSVPTFWLGIILLVVFGQRLRADSGAVPGGGHVDAGDLGRLHPQHILDVLWHLVLPCLTLVLVVFAQYQMIMRSYR